jgi:hypothetical protein
MPSWPYDVSAAQAGSKTTGKLGQGCMTFTNLVRTHKPTG